jgi:hypothetical protein
MTGFYTYPGPVHSRHAKQLSFSTTCSRHIKTDLLKL